MNMIVKKKKKLFCPQCTFVCLQERAKKNGRPTKCGGEEKKRGGGGKSQGQDLSELTRTRAARASNARQMGSTEADREMNVSLCGTEGGVGSGGKKRWGRGGGV